MPAAAATETGGAEIKVRRRRRQPRAAQPDTAPSTATSPLSRKRKRDEPRSQPAKPAAPAPVKDAEERALESLLFGSGLNFALSQRATATSADSAEAEAANDSEGEDGPAFVIDKRGAHSGVTDDTIDDHDDPSPAATEANKVVWHDPDDSRHLIDLTSSKRMLKLRANKDERFISSQEYQQRLRALYKNLNHAASWALTPSQPQSESVSASMSVSLDALLASDRSLLREEQSKLPFGHLDIKPLRDANFAEPAQGVVHSVEFHPRTPLLLTAGMDATIRLFHIDTLTNPKIQSIRFPDLPIQCSHFINNGREIVSTGRRKFFYSYDIESGSVSRTPYIKGHDEEKSWENFYCHTDWQSIAMLANNGAIVMIDSASKQYQYSLKMNGSVRSIAYQSRTNTLYSYGNDGDIYQWDLRTRRCVNVVKDYGSHRGLKLALTNADNGGDDGMIATGGESGIVNLHRTSSLFASNSSNDRQSVNSERQPVKVIDSLTTPIDTLTFSPTDELLLLSSRRGKDSLSLYHTGSLTGVTNWPTEQTPLHYVTSAGFSPNSGYLAVGNDRGRVLLYRLKHFPTM